MALEVEHDNSEKMRDALALSVQTHIINGKLSVCIESACVVYCMQYVSLFVLRAIILADIYGVSLNN